MSDRSSTLPPPADDRDFDSEYAKAQSAAPNLEALRNLWTERDARYTARKASLKDGEIAIVRAFRISETRDLPVAQRAAGYREAMSWVPPVVVIS